MDWLNQVTDLVDKYRGGSAGPTHESVDADFDRFSRHAPEDTLSEGLAHAFRSPQTPPFASMLSRLFGSSPASQKSNVLNSLIATLGPAIAAQLFASHGANRAAQELQQGNTVLSPEAAEAVPASSLEAAAAEAEKKDPSIVDRISAMYAQQPALVKTLGKVALMVAMAKLAQRQSRPAT